MNDSKDGPQPDFKLNAALDYNDGSGIDVILIVSITMKYL